MIGQHLSDCCCSWFTEYVWCAGLVRGQCDLTGGWVSAGQLRAHAMLGLQEPIRLGAIVHVSCRAMNGV